MISLIQSVLGIFININKNKENENYKSFILKLSNLSDFHVEPYLNLCEYIKSKSIDKDIEEEAQTFKNMIDLLYTSREKKRDRTMSVLFLKCLKFNKYF